jgi:hypothetical protein
MQFISVEMFIYVNCNARQMHTAVNRSRAENFASQYQIVILCQQFELHESPFNFN